MTRARIQWIGGPVLKARASEPFQIHEALAVGEQRLLGEVIQLSGDLLTAQVYEDTTGLKPGDPVIGNGLPLSVSLGPGILGNIFDGLLRPLSEEAGHWFKPGLAAARSGRFEFEPLVGSGDQVSGGQVFGKVAGDGPGRGCLVPPLLSGRVGKIRPAGDYAEDEPVLEIEAADGQTHTIAMQHDWPVRRPRPAAERLSAAGHGVVVFERYPRPGGLLAYGVPRFKLSAEVIEAKVGWLARQGIRFFCNLEVGTDVTVRELLARYDAVFLAVGAQQQIRPGIPGEELEGVHDATSFLCRTNLSEQILPPAWRA
ncbi:MAG: hypothetical protein ACOC0Q_05360, partial [Wenzhouxiangella sp.]